MQYMFLIYDAEDSGAPKPGTEEFAAHVAEYGKFSEDVQAAGVMLGGNALNPVSTATTVRVRDAKTNVTDGPFAETKELLGGYYILDCKDLDEAISWAAKIPGSRFGCVEIRPVMVFD